MATTTTWTTQAATNFAAEAKDRGLVKNSSAYKDALALAKADAKNGGDGTFASVSESINTGEAWVSKVISGSLGSGVVDKGLGQSLSADLKNKEKAVERAISAITGQPTDLSLKVKGSSTYKKDTKYNVGFSLNVSPTTAKVDVPAVYGSKEVTTTSEVTTLVTTQKAVTNARVVTDVSYTTERSSNISYSMIPFTRAISVLVNAKGLKPNTQFSAFFGGVNVSSNISYATILNVASVVSYSFLFDATTEGGFSADTARSIPNNPVNTLLAGDKITDLTTGATGILVGIELGANNTKNLFIVNVKGTFSTSNVVTGSTSTSRGSINSITTSSALVSSNYGNVYGIFTIPNSPDKRFATGKNLFLLSETDQDALSSDSFARTDFISNGTLSIAQPIVTSIRVETPRIQEYITYTDVTSPVTATVSSTATESFLITPASTALVTTATGNTFSGSSVVKEFQPTDPLAQSFWVDEPTGICLSSIDLFFASKDPVLPLSVSIINMTDGGQPGTMTVPLSKVVVQSSDVNLSSNTLISAIDGRTYYAADTPTNIKFNAPIFLEGQKEYCIYIHSDSFKYNLWTSYMNDATVNGNGMVAKQPLLGTLFTSQNSSTWSTDQLQDLCFNLYRAKFTPNVNVTVPFVNSTIPSIPLRFDNIIATVGSNILRIRARNHGLLDGHKVTISGIDAGTYFGIPSAQLNAQFTVANAELDFFTITVAATATSSGFISNADAWMTTNVRIDSIRPAVNELVRAGTNIDYTYKATTSANVKQSAFTAVDNYKQADTAETLFALSTENETTFTAGLGGEKSFTLNATLSTESEYITPFIDAQRVQCVTASNKINNPTVALNVTGVDYDSLASLWVANGYSPIVGQIVYTATNVYQVTTAGVFSAVSPSHTTGTVANGTVQLLWLSVIATQVITVNTTNKTLVTANALLQAIWKKLAVGSYVTISNGTGVNNGVFRITAADSIGGTYIELDTTLVAETAALYVLYGKRFREENAPGGSSSIASYVSKELQFENLSTSFKLIYTYNKPAACNVKFYYKISNSYDSTNHATQPYIALTPSKPLVSSENKTDLTTGSLHAEKLSSFNTLSIKVVYTSTTPNKFPRLRDFRIIALA